MPRINPEYREDAKKKIIEAAVDVALDGGWGSVTLEAIAQKVGVTKGAFYSYFPSSMALMQDVIIAMIRRIRDHVLACVSGADDIHTALERIADFIFLQPKPFILIFIQAISSAPKDPAFLQRISDLFDENSALIMNELARARENGQVPAEVDLREATRAIYCMTIGLGLAAHVLQKDRNELRQTWLTSAERILLLDRWEQKGRR
ncbi:MULTISPECIES: TetR/AcrR family transcriptional regulator [unclassified Methanoregula]|uniref:TetR/AcrR family transcriptional regulator n=1 Tax=unclassified Methanoregula TaxID=2649730 RepID=UPI0025D067B3|nr:MULTISPECIES: TetR/AcrR family transcriptional regulator [unclassified Methanoregula]